jgi:hypothetical protein
MREHLGVGFTCARRWGNDLVADAEWATSSIRPSSPSGLVESCRRRWVREVDVFSHPAAANLPYAPRNRAVVARSSVGSRCRRGGGVASLGGGLLRAWRCGPGKP